MGILLSCCFKGGFEEIGGSFSSKTKSRKTHMTSLLADKKSGQVDGRKVSSPPPNYGVEEADRYPSAFAPPSSYYQQDSPPSDTASIRSGKAGHGFGGTGSSNTNSSGGGLFRSKTLDRQKERSSPTSFGSNVYSSSGKYS